MSDAPSVSVIVVSRDRPQALVRCLKGLEQLLYPNLELVVVADQPGLAAIHALGWSGRIKARAFEEANISAARNAGITAAAGEIVAFIDDDAVPEPTWLTALVAPFAEPTVMAAGGFVRGRNGISFQWTARSVDAAGETTPLSVDEEKASLLTPPLGRAIKTEGTNMAFRRHRLAELGGFDPAFRFYLDETDLNFRLGQAGDVTAIVPLAEVHHGFDASPRRRADRVPRTLHEVGASTAVFMRKHTPTEDIATAETRFVGEQRKRLLRHMVAGRLEPSDVHHLMKSLRAGLEDGKARALTSLPPLARASDGFLPFPTFAPAPSGLIRGRIWRKSARRREAADLVNAGGRATLFLFSPTILYHRVRFDDEGFWEHRGGIFGRSVRSQPWFRLTTFGARARAEAARIATQRGLG